MTEAIQNPTADAAAPAPEVALSPREKLLAKYNKLFAKAAEIRDELTAVVAEINAIDSLASISVGTVVLITVGKKEAAKEVQATVVGVRDDEDGSKSFKVTYGTGFEADIAVVKASKVRLPAAEAQAE